MSFAGRAHFLNFIVSFSSRGSARMKLNRIKRAIRGSRGSSTAYVIPGDNSRRGTLNFVNFSPCGNWTPTPLLSSLAFIVDLSLSRRGNLLFFPVPEMQSQNWNETFARGRTLNSSRACFLLNCFTNLFHPPKSQEVRCRNTKGKARKCFVVHVPYFVDRFVIFVFLEFPFR